MLVYLFILSLNKSVRSQSDAVDGDGMILSSVPLFAFSGQPRTSLSIVSHLARMLKVVKAFIRVVSRTQATKASYRVEVPGTGAPPSTLLYSMKR